MVRNSKRKAFTIVELVIVIAVIAILAAVMIPTFGGVIESANVSADKQMLSGMNSQISIYIGTGNKIETEADLWEALKGEKTTGGTDFTTKLNPKSAKHGYHYFYESASQTVQLREYSDFTKPANASFGKMTVRADGLEVRAAGEDFALASPRSFMDGFYFLDKVADGEGNDFAKLFESIENLSKTETSVYTDRRDVITNLSNRDDNKDFADKLVERLNVTAILTDKDPITNGGEVDHVYIPENKTDDKDYTLKSGSISVSAKFNVTVTLPENVNPGEALNDMTEQLQTRETPAALKVEATITFETEDELAEKIGEIFGVGSVTGGTITINGSITASATEKEVVIGEQTIALKYQNPVTEQVDVSASGNIVNNYIALNKIKHGDIDISFTHGELLGADGTKVFYQDVEWEIVDAPAGVSFNEDKTKLIVDSTFAGTSITLKAKPVAVNDEAQKEALAGTVTLTVVKVNSIEVDFGALVGQDLEDLTVSVKYSDATTAAKFSGIVLYYTLMDGTALTPFTPAEIATLGAPSVTMTTTDTYFTVAAPVNNEYNFVFKTDAIKNITGKVTETVTVAVEDVATYAVKVNIEPSIFAPVHVYKNDFRYTVGNANTITLEKLFGLSTFFAGKDANFNGKVQIKTYNADPDYVSEGKYTQAYTSGTDYVFTANTSDWKQSTIQLNKLGPTAVEISTTGDNAVSYIVEVNVVAGKNITQKSEFAIGGSTTSLVLHSDLSGFAPANGSVLQLSGGASLYGNYYTIDASGFKDADGKTGFLGLGSSTATGYTFVNLTNGSLNQVVLSGPVYPDAAIMDRLDTAGYFCFGIGIYGSSNTINDCFLSGFNSPIYSDTTTLNVNNTTFEGGALANVYIRKATTVNFTGVTTIQNRVTAYKANIDGKTNATLGMGIFIHEDQNDIGNMTMNLKDVEQYNWLSSNDKDKGGTYIDLAVDKVFKDDYKGFWHTVDGVNYVNAAIAAVNKKATTIITINNTVTSGTPHAYHDGTGEAESGTDSGTVWVATYECDGTCCSDAKVNFTNGDNFQACINAFLATRVN